MLKWPISHLLANDISAGAAFRVSGAEIVVTDALAIPAEVRTALKDRRDELFTHLASVDTGEPTSSAILKAEGIVVAVATTESEATALLAEVLTEAGDRPLGLDIETAPKPEYAKPRVAVKLTRTGAVAQNQPKDKSRVGLDPLRSEPRLVQVYGGGSRCAVFDMRSIPWSVLEPLWRRRLVIHHAQFELGFLQARGILPGYFECTLQAAGLMLGVHRRGLAATAEAYLGWKMPKGLQTSD
jgi:hypothetical protein